MFVKIMVFVKILGKGRRRKEGGRISILRSARGKLIALKKTFNFFFLCFMHWETQTKSAGFTSD